ncbi:DUF1402 family protein [Hoeflea prorocentri]|uniref:DUF1402 family protein n=1 Tax=Hoeflea prorocentri TaxID=1922333 RepID=A0A9X3UM63_9HYPH|nr:DUF1402 family protein [Hoeflea prorocentri]MCY6383154.1 DUF1402 family protein [Hoeflea prorocentri]MDA5400954.1 DUF1402 family protein [Hoeflea prorocentri]
MRRHLFQLAAIVVCSLVFFAPVASAKLVMVPEGNRNEVQPTIPGASVKRTKQTKSTFERKYRKIHDLLKRDTKLRGKIKSVAAKYDIDPLHIVGALVGEHTYNVDAYDRLQSYYVKAMSYATGGINFRYDGENVDTFIRREEFSDCENRNGSFAVWSCREAVWEKNFRNRKVDGKRFPNDRFSAVFFQPFYAGQTFGLGQLNPLTALKLTDKVNRVSGYKKLTHENGQDVYKAIMNPDITLAYVAAALRHSIDVYGDIAGFDISENPGITATLYNVGNPDRRARALARKNKQRRAQGKRAIYPKENYYGWLVNDKLAELRQLF